MQIDLHRDVPAALDAMLHAVRTLDEYPMWGADVRADNGALVWRLPISDRAVADMSLHVAPTDDGARVVLRRGMQLRYELRVRCEASGRGWTRVTIEAGVHGVRAMTTAAAVHMGNLETFGNGLTSRARWLHQAPDTRYVAARIHVNAFSGRVVAPPESDASLEQLLALSRELEGGILAVDCGATWCLLDRARHRFVRANAGADVGRLVAFGQWHDYDAVICDGDSVVVVPSAGAAPLRLRPQAHGARPVLQGAR